MECTLAVPCGRISKEVVGEGFQPSLNRSMWGNAEGGLKTLPYRMPFDYRCHCGEGRAPTWQSAGTQFRIAMTIGLVPVSPQPGRKPHPATAGRVKTLPYGVI